MFNCVLPASLTRPDKNYANTLTVESERLDPQAEPQTMRQSIKESLGTVVCIATVAGSILIFAMIAFLIYLQEETDHFQVVKRT